MLFIACANVGNLLLVRAFGRQLEMTIRVAVGAGRGRLVKQLLMEGLILSVIAAAGGITVANLPRNALAMLVPRIVLRGCRASSTGACSPCVSARRSW